MFKRHSGTRGLGLLGSPICNGPGAIPPNVHFWLQAEVLTTSQYRQLMGSKAEVNNTMSICCSTQVFLEQKSFTLIL